jgi:hypothetical protein
MHPLNIFNMLPGISSYGFPPWLVAYLLLVVPLFPLFKCAFRVY